MSLIGCRTLMVFATMLSISLAGRVAVGQQSDDSSNGGFFCASALPDKTPDDSSPDSKLDLKQLAIDAVSDNSEISAPAISKLRDSGPAGLDALFATHQDEITRHFQVKTTRVSDSNWKRLSEALDVVGGQYDCATSHLYWYTDFDAAKAAAAETGKPILSLRLLGKLTDEFSCANSRYFRSTLYTNQEISDALRTRFVLHWQSERPVPKVTIDFGDGRKLERTLTGNSIHYVLDPQGRVIDALPGLYGPKAFLHGLQTAEAAIDQMKSLTNERRDIFLQQYHADQSKLILAAWQKDLTDLRIPPTAMYQKAKKSQTKAMPDDAATAGKLAMTKYIAEQPLVTSVNNPDALASKTDDTIWTQIARLHQSDAQLDDASMAYIASQNPTAGRAMPLTASKAAIETPMMRLVRSLQGTIAIDSIKNEYTFHRQIHDWFAGGKVAPAIDVNDLNEMVYAELFLTPSSDPWLGLLPRDAYTALENDGLSKN